MKVFQKSFEEIAEAIKSRYGHYWIGEKFCPAPERLAEIVEVCYWASMLEEEQRRTQCQVMCASEMYVDEQFSPGPPPNPCDVEWHVGKLDRKPLTANELKKLAGGLDESNAGILVWSDEKGAYIWGIVRFRHGGNSINPHDQHWTRKHALRIVVNRPGHLTFDDLSQIFGEIADAEFEIRKSLPIFSYPGFFANAFGNLSSFALQMWKDQKYDLGVLQLLDVHSESTFAGIYSSVMLVILRTMQQHRCGGTLVIAAEPADKAVKDDGWRLSDLEGEDGMNSIPHLFSKYFRFLLQCEPFNVEQEFSRDDWMERELDPVEVRRLTRFEVAGGLQYRIRELFKSYGELARAARFLGRLTAADGAVIVSPDLRIISFGTKLNSDAAVEPRLLTFENMNMSVEDIGSFETYKKTRGSRFKSAVSAARTLDSLVFVASEDGPVSAFVRNGDDDVLMAEPISLETPIGS